MGVQLALLKIASRWPLSLPPGLIWSCADTSCRLSVSFRFCNSLHVAVSCCFVIFPCCLSHYCHVLCSFADLFRSPWTTPSLPWGLAIVSAFSSVGVCLDRAAWPGDPGWMPNMRRFHKRLTEAQGVSTVSNPVSVVVLISFWNCIQQDGAHLRT